jgi:hypothetical protein
MIDHADTSTIDNATYGEELAHIDAMVLPDYQRICIGTTLALRDHWRRQPQTAPLDQLSLGDILRLFGVTGS